MQQGFQIGQTVELNSGGPLMTVHGIEADVVACVWFEGAALRSADFRSGLLTPPSSANDDDCRTYLVDNFG